MILDVQDTILSERITSLEKQNNLILQQIELLTNINYTPQPWYVHPWDIRAPSMSSFNSTPTRATRIPMSTLLTPSTPNSDSRPSTLINSNWPVPASDVMIHSPWDIRAPSMSHHPNFNSTPTQATRPMSMLLTPSTPNSDSRPSTPSTISSNCPVPASDVMIHSPSSTSAVISPSSNATITVSSNSSSSTIASTSKENKVPPPIPYNELITSKAVLQKYPKLMKLSKISTLAVRLAKEAYFGVKVMAGCTVRGIGLYQPFLNLNLTQ